MVSKILMPTLNMKHFAFPVDISSQSSPSFGRVSLPKRSKMMSQSRKSIIASGMLPTNNEATLARTFPTLAHSWREIQGFNNWENLVDPLHPLLRQEIIRYGEFVTACYKAFDVDPNSKRYLNCKYGKKSMLKEIGMGDSDYEVTKYIYVTPDINLPIQHVSSCSRWIGYVAVSSGDSVKSLGRRDIVVTFRGTVTNPEWMANFMSSLTPARLDPNNPRPDVKVESGFLNLYTSDESDKFGVDSCREQLLSELSKLLNKYEGEEMSITLAGHSMGSSLALLLAYDIAELGLNKNRRISSDSIPVTVFSYGGPRVGNSDFKDRCEELGVKVLRIVNANDPITKLPGVFFNENFRVLGGRVEFPWIRSYYAHVGAELVLDFFNMQNPTCVHDLETYIRLLKSPNPQSQSKKEHIVADFLNKAGEFVLITQNFNVFPLKMAAGNMVSLVQSLRT